MFLTPADGARIARELKDIIGRDINIMDRTGTIIASTNPRRVGHLHAAARRIIEQQLPELAVTAADESAGIQEGINLPIRVGGVLEGVLGITGPAEHVRELGAVAKKMAEILLTAMGRREQQTLLQQARNLFIEAWLFDPQPDWPALAMRGSLLEIDVRCPRRVAILEAAGTADELRRGRILQMLAPHLAGSPQSLATVVNQRILVLFADRCLDQAAAIAAAFCRQAADEGVQLSAGLSTVSRGAADLRRCYSEARIAVRAAARAGTIREYTAGALDLVLQSMDEAVRRDVLRAVFPPMSEQEASEAGQCLRLYFQCDGSVEQAAALACVHPNTFRYRMEKLRRATGLDLRRPKDTALLYLALQLLEDAPGENPSLPLDKDGPAK